MTGRHRPWAIVAAAIFGLAIIVASLIVSYLEPASSYGDGLPGMLHWIIE